MAWKIHWPKFHEFLISGQVVKIIGQVRSRTEDLSHAKGARYQLRHMPILYLMIEIPLLKYLISKNGQLIDFIN